MSLTVAVTRVACNTSTGNQSITTADLGGLTPAAAILIATYAVTDGTAAVDAIISYGAVTGASNRWCIAGTDEDAQARADTSRYFSTASCVRIMNPGLTSADGEADFNAWISDGIQINWSNAPASAYLLTVVLFAGTDLSAHANTVAGITVDTTTDVTDPGFEPDVLVTGSTATGLDAGTNNYVMARGLVHNDRASTITQRAMCHTSGNNTANGEPRSRCTASGGVIITLDGTEQNHVEFSAFDSSGFSATARTNSTEPFGYLALRFGSGPVSSSWVGTHSTPTGTPPISDSETGPGFTPQFVMMLGSHMEAVDTSYTDQNAGTNCISTFDEDDEYCDSNSAEDAAATMNTQSLSDNTAVELPDDDGTTRITAAFTSFDANGWTLNYTAVAANAKLFFALAIGEFVAPAGRTTKNTDPYGLGIAPGVSRTTKTIGL